jgi:plasmid stability protein
MSIPITLPQELETRLKVEATRRGLSPEVFAAQVLDQHLPVAERREATAAMLEDLAREIETMSDEEAAENAAVLRAIDDDRPSDRKLFTHLAR